MPTQLQLEGPDLESLLARVRAEHGASARIVRAEKVRTGGVGGFFAKQHYEINVEVEEAATGSPPAPVARPTSILDLADEVSDTERATTTVSTESTGFAAVLARLGATAGEPGPAAPPAAVRVPAQRRAPSAETRSPAPRPAPAPTPARRSAAVARRAPSPAPAALEVRTVRAAAAPRSAGTASTSVGTVAVRARGTVARTAPARTAAAAPAPSRTAARRPARTTGALQATAGGAVRRADGVQQQLLDLGLPEHLVPDTVPGDLAPALTASLRALPRIPRTVVRSGGTLAVVGPLHLAQEAARSLARELDLPRSAVVVAQDLQADTGPGTARRRSRTTVVVVDAPLTALGAARARSYLRALAPDATWAVVEATRKTRDVGAWTRGLGGVDALALTAVDETNDPAAVLELGIPVGRLEGRPATPAQWAALLSKRVAA